MIVDAAQEPDTVTSTEPTVWAGEVAVIWVAEFTVNDVAGVAPKDTLVTPMKLLPLMAITVPPAVGPDVGTSEVTVGAAKYSNRSALAAAEIPLVVVT